MGLTDSYGRRISYLRLSVTDRCNLRCQYCMPAQGVPKLCHSDILSYEDLYRIACQAVALGVEKIRVTGGEPLVRKGVIAFIERLSGIAGVRELTLTTNGILLRDLALSLRRAGLTRINVSLDSLKPETFAAITRGGEVQRVLDGMAAAAEAGFPPVKLNVVVMRGINDDEILDFAALTLRHPYTVRFIEYMPTTRDPHWQQRCLTGDAILERIRARYHLVPLRSAELSGPAKNFSIPGSAGAIGVITPMSHHFCDDCNRIRVTATGMVKGCLFGADDVDLKPHLRSLDREVLRNTLLQIVAGKPNQHQLGNPYRAQGWVAMSQIGG
jgi:cyclic pyranopterin phosphate synthase